MLFLPLALALGGLVAAAEPEPPADLARVARLATTGIVPASEQAFDTAEYIVESAPRGTVVFMLPAGPRSVRSIDVFPTPSTAPAWPSARLLLTWENDDTDPNRAAVDLPLGIAFGRAPGLPVMESVFLGTSRGAWVNRFPMPYRTQALLRIDTRLPLGGRILVRTARGVSPDAGYFRAALWTNSERLSETGRGQLAGLILMSDGPVPQSTGRLVVDGNSSKPIGSAFGADGLPSGSKPLFGLLATESGRSASYRWRVDDPIPFRRSFVVEAGAGAPEVAQSAAVFWYSENPGPIRIMR